MPELGPNNDGISKELKVNNVPLLPEKAGPWSDGEEKVPLIEVKPEDVLTPEQYNAEVEAKEKKQGQKEDDNFVPKNGSIDDNKANPSYNVGMGKENPFGGAFASKIEAKIVADRKVSTYESAIFLTNNQDFFGYGEDDEKRSEIANKVLGRLDSKYRSVEDIIAVTRPESNKNVKRGEADLASVAESVFMAMNMSALGESLITETMTAEQIDQNLPEQFKGIGVEVVKIRMAEDEKNRIAALNKRVEEEDLFLSQDKKGRGKMADELKGDESTLVGRYEKVLGKILEDLGVDKGEIDGKRRKQGKNIEDDYGPERIDYGEEPPGDDDADSVGAGKRKGRGFSYGPELREFAKAVIESRQTDYRESSPPQWLKEKDDQDEYWYRMADYMSSCADNKTALKDSVKGLEKLWFDDNIRMKLNEADFEVMYGNKGFRFAVERILKDMCVFEKRGANNDGGEFLYLRKDAFTKIYDLDNYKAEMSMLVCKIKAYGNRDFEESFKNEINRLMSVNRVSEKQVIKLWQEKNHFYDAQIEAGTAWNFLYNCNFLESADYNRELWPTDAARGDTVNFVFHPDAKVNSKLEEDKILLGKEEVKGGPLADWYLYQLEHNPQFRREYDQGMHRLFPKRLCVSFLDTYSVYTTKREKMTMAKALFNGEEIDCSRLKYSEQIRKAKERDGVDVEKNKAASKLSMFKDYKDLLEGALTTFKYLTGEAPLDGKNTQQWAIGIKNGMALLRQQEVNVSGGRLPELDQPNIYAAIIYASFGLNRADRLMTVKKIFPDYRTGLEIIAMQDFVKSSDKTQNISRKEWIPTPFQKRVFEIIYKDAVTRTLNDLR